MFSRNSKVASFIEKDSFMLNHYEKSPFVSLNHAVEVLLPYHIYANPLEDLKFLGALNEIDLRQEIDIMADNFTKTVIDVQPKISFTAQLILLHEKVYFSNKLESSKVPLIKKRELRKTRPKYIKKRVAKKGVFLRFKYCKSLFIYGTITKTKIHMKSSHFE
ncbi:hypothetical protein HERIO_2626 [Hepatospora eriocheir]|uniref:GLTSCR protein conserved domain-containing protein n=1 Tax=Hepatospora eriocheir TaxID=1081669 RepID=A0A1X0Q673_9MICR|nr:hypothetical protein HERIO_2626 [Hepatospora eriocheir]